MKFKDTLNRLGDISRQLRKQGVTVESLDKAIGDLETHQENIEKIESNIDAIREEVVAPLQRELAQNKSAGRFSIFGFWVGAVALVVSIVTTLVQQTGIGRGVLPVDSSNVEILRRLNSIENHLLFPPDIQVIKGQSFVANDENVEIATINDEKVYLRVRSVTVWPKGEGLKAGVRIFKGNVVIGKVALKGALVRSDGKTGFHRWFNDDSIAVAEGDSLRLGKTTIVVVKVLSRNAEGRPFGDDKTGIVVRVISEEKAL